MLYRLKLKNDDLMCSLPLSTLERTSVSVMTLPISGVLDGSLSGPRLLATHLPPASSVPWSWGSRSATSQAVAEATENSAFLGSFREKQGAATMLVEGEGWQLLRPP